MEENGHKYLVKTSSLLNTMNSRVNRSIGRAPKEEKNKNFLQILQKSDQSIQKTRFKVWDKLRILKYDNTFRKGYKSQITSEIFETVNIATYKPPTYNLKGEQGDEILGKFYEQELSNYIISDELFYGRAGFQLIF